MENYSQGAIYSVQRFEKFRQDVAEVTMKQVKHPFYDIVKEITGNDPMLWRTEEDWILSASFFSVDFEKVINFFKVENEYYVALKELLNKIESEENQYLKLSRGQFAKVITNLNNQGNIILERASMAGEAKPGSLVVQAYYDVMLKIRSIDEKYHLERELQRVLQELQSHIEYHRNLLEKNLLDEFENAINTAVMPIRQKDEKLRSHTEVAKLISELKK